MNTFNEDTVSHNKFTMFRCLIAIAHADGFLSNEEKIYFSAFVNHLPFSDEQKNTFETDFKEPQNVFDLFKNINDPKYRANVLDFGRIMAFKDGTLDPAEDDILKKLYANITDSIDIDEIKAEARQVVRHEMNLHEVSIDMNRPDTPVFQLIDEILLFFGIDLMRD